MASVGAAPAKKAAWVERSRARNQEDRNHFVRPLLLLEEIALVRPNRPAAFQVPVSPINHCCEGSLGHQGQRGGLLSPLQHIAQFCTLGAAVSETRPSSRGNFQCRPSVSSFRATARLEEFSSSGGPNASPVCNFPFSFDLMFFTCPGSSSTSPDGAPGADRDVLWSGCEPLGKASS